MSVVQFCREAEVKENNIKHKQKHVFLFDSIVSPINTPRSQTRTPTHSLFQINSPLPLYPPIEIE